MDYSEVAKNQTSLSNFHFQNSASRVTELGFSVFVTLVLPHFVVSELCILLIHKVVMVHI